MEWLNSIKTVGVETQADSLLLNRKGQKKLHFMHISCIYSLEHQKR